MQVLNLPSFPFHQRSLNGREQIFCFNRKKWLILTPEEWVRQHWLAYLDTALKYPVGLTSVEKSITIGKVNKRYDIVVYSKEAQPYLLIELKAPKIKANQEALEQAARYNLALKAPFLLISNGMQHHCLSVNASTEEIKMLSAIPAFQA